MSATSLEVLQGEPLVFDKGTDPGHPFQTDHGGHKIVIRLGDFPAEAMYTLIVDGEAGEEFDDWPAAWKRPEKRGLLDWMRKKA